MDYDLKKPCDCCPFRRGTPMRLTKARVREVVGGMLNTNGGEFPCHKTIEYLDVDDDGTQAIHVNKPNSKHCAGALIFAEKNKTSTQMMRICERIGMYDAAALMANKENVDAVFNTFGEALKHLTSPQEGDELNKEVDKDSRRIQSSRNEHDATANGRNKRADTDGGPKRRRRNVVRPAVS